MPQAGLQHNINGHHVWLFQSFDAKYKGLPFTADDLNTMGVATHIHPRVGIDVLTYRKALWTETTTSYKNLQNIEFFFSNERELFDTLERNTETL